MNRDEKSDHQAQEAARKKPYLKPSFQREQVFETMALICGKVQSTQSGCKSSRKNS